MSDEQASELAILRECLRQAERKAEAERQRAEEADRRTEVERQRADETNKRIQATTLEECLHACHRYLHNALSVETDKLLTTKGFTNPKNKFYPTLLRPWEDFPELQSSVFYEAYKFFHPPEQPPVRCLNSVHYLEELGQNLSQRKLASEADLESFERTTVEGMVTRIIGQLCAMDPARTQFQLGQGVTFDNHTNSLSDAAEEVQQYLHIRTPRASPQPSSSSSSGSDSKPTRTRADQFCVFRNSDGIRKLLLVVEYKPPHKLSVGNLQAGFRPMNIEDILMAATIPNELEARLQYNADKLAAAVVTQTFHYMVENGLEFSYITTGEAFVFLHVQKEDPTTLYYHLAVPGDEVSNEEPEFSIPQIAISQVMSLCLIAFQSEQRNHRWRRDAKKKLKKYIVDYEAILRQIPETERKLSPASTYKGRKNANPRESPYPTRRKAQEEKARARTRTSCDLDELRLGDDGQSDPDTPSKQRKGRLQLVSQTKSNEDTADKRSNTDNHPGSKGRQRQYCTQECLLGLVRGMVLDKRCPNVMLHSGHTNWHAIDGQEFMRLVRSQLKDDLDNNCEPLGLQGARGALFKLTLASHGYVFVGKGTVRAFVPALSWEGSMYQKLRRLQGTAVPVYLGNIQLAHRYYLDVDVRISHMLLMSWAGAIVEETIDGQEIRRTVEEVQAEGVDQGDVRMANLLWNPERKRVMLIDFERAKYISYDKPSLAKDERVLQEMSPNKKRKRVEFMKERY
ncbi:MAG: hypothetical protein Q9187_000527 [Circinaria calcarea]